MFSPITYLSANKGVAFSCARSSQFRALCTRNCVIVGGADGPNTSVPQRDWQGRGRTRGDGTHPAHRSPHFLPSLAFNPHLGVL